LRPAPLLFLYSSKWKIVKKRLLIVKEASEYLGITENALYCMVYRRQIPFVKIGKRLRFDKIDLDKWIEKQKILDNETITEKILNKI
jgi:excisionase family DNA binding protein